MPASTAIKNSKSSMQLPLAVATSLDWVRCVTEDLDAFLIDHAACERKASATALSLMMHYPDRPNLVERMNDLALEELSHFREVMRIILARGIVVTADRKDPYIVGLMKQIRHGAEHYLLDRLVIGSIVEARGCERFALLGKHLEDRKLSRFYQALAKSEGLHYQLFLDLAHQYFPKERVVTRYNELLTYEAELVQLLALRAALH